MALRFKYVNPLEMREPIVEFFWGAREWPYATKEEYFRYWDWRYTALSESSPMAWVAQDKGRVIGHIAIYFRHLSVGEHQVRVGVPGNFRVDRAYQTSLIGGTLASAPRTLLQKGDIDLLMGYGNETAHGVFLALGCRDLGSMETFIEIRRWAPTIMRWRIPQAVAALAMRARRSNSRATPRVTRNALVARALSPSEIQAFDRAHWRRRDALTWDGSLAYFARRFSPSEFRSYRVFGILDTNTGRLEGLVATDGTAQLNILECEVNEAVVSAVQAVELAARTVPKLESVRVPLVPNSELAQEFMNAGFFRLPRTLSYRTIRNSFWSAHWRPDHPLAAKFATTERWNVWYGWSAH